MLLLDTDVMIDILREFSPAIKWLKSMEAEEIRLPGFVALELYQGCRSKSEASRVERVLSAMEIVWPDAEVCTQALELYVQYHLSHSLAVFDALIGQTAVALESPLCTFNQKHYSAVPMLDTIQPYKR